MSTAVRPALMITGTPGPEPAGEGELRLQPFDAAYVARLRAGDVETERHFAAYFGTLVVIKLRRRLRSRHLIEDIRQETFLRVLRTLRDPDGLRDARSLGAFVNAVCNNVMRELVRREGRDPQAAAGPGDARPATDPDPEDTLLSRETELLVRRVLHTLPPRDQALLRALFVDEQERDQICAQFGVDRGYLRVLLHRAKNQFRARRLEGLA